MLKISFYKAFFAILLLIFSISDLLQHKNYLLGWSGVAISIMLLGFYVYKALYVSDGLNVNKVLSKLKKGDKIRVIVYGEDLGTRMIRDCIVIENIPSKHKIVLQHKLFSNTPLDRGYTYQKISDGFFSLNKKLGDKKNLDELQMELNEALEDQHYESAAILRDAIKKLKEQGNSSKTSVKQ